MIVCHPGYEDQDDHHAHPQPQHQRPGLITNQQSRRNIGFVQNTTPEPTHDHDDTGIQQQQRPSLMASQSSRRNLDDRGAHNTTPDHHGGDGSGHQQHHRPSLTANQQSRRHLDRNMSHRSSSFHHHDPDTHSVDESELVRQQYYRHHHHAPGQRHHHHPAEHHQHPSPGLTDPDYPNEGEDRNGIINGDSGHGDGDGDGGGDGGGDDDNASVASEESFQYSQARLARRSMIAVVIVALSSKSLYLPHIS
jgi:hypothetical protein